MLIKRLRGMNKIVVFSMGFLIKVPRSSMDFFSVICITLGRFTLDFSSALEITLSVNGPFFTWMILTSRTYIN